MNLSCCSLNSNQYNLIMPEHQGISDRMEVGIGRIGASLHLWGTSFQSEVDGNCAFIFQSDKSIVWGSAGTQQPATVPEAAADASFTTLIFLCAVMNATRSCWSGCGQAQSRSK